MSAMTVKNDPPVDHDASDVSDHTRALAKRLAGHLGLEGAIQISTENQWHGVLSVLLEMKKTRSKSK